MRLRTSQRMNILIMKTGIAALIMTAIGLLTIGCRRINIFSLTRTPKHENLTTYVENLTGIQLNDVATSEEGYVKSAGVEDGGWNEEYAQICLELKEGGVRETAQRLEESGRHAYDESYVYPFGNTELAKRLAESTISWQYAFAFEGEKAKTRSVEVYLATDPDGKECLFWFG